MLRSWPLSIILARYSALLIAVLFVGARLLLLDEARDPWVDEAMLTANLPLTTINQLFHPLPLFAQAAPLGYLLPANLLSIIFPTQETLALRWLAVAASVIAAFALVAALRELQLRRLIPVALAVGFLSALGLRYALETKHYGFETMAGALLLWAGSRLSVRRDTGSALLFGLIGLVAVLTSFTMPIIFAALCGGFAMSEWRHDRPMADPTATATALISAAIVGVAFIANYILLVRPATMFQMVSYGELYRMKMLSLPISGQAIARWLRLPLVLGDLVSPGIFTRWARALVAGMVLALIVTGLSWLWRRATILAIAVPIALLCICLLSLGGKLPIGEPRHLLVLLPLLTIVVAAGLAEVVDRYTPNAIWVEPAFALLFAISGIVAAVHTLPREQVSPVYAIYRAESNGEPLWAFAWSQPTLHEIAPEQLLIAPLSEVSSPLAWDAVVMRPEALELNGGQLRSAYVDQFGKVAAERAPMWALFSHYLNRKNLDRMLDAAADHDVNCTRRGQQGSVLLFRCDRNRPSGL